MLRACRRANVLLMRIGADALTMCVPKSIAARTQSGGCAYHGGDEKALLRACRGAKVLLMRIGADALTMCVPKSIAARTQSRGCAYHGGDEKHCCAHAVERTCFSCALGRMRLPCACRKALLRARSRADVLTMVVMKSVASRMPSSRCASHAHWGGCAYHVRAEKHCCAHAVGRMCLPWW